VESAPSGVTGAVMASAGICSDSGRGALHRKQVHAATHPAAHLEKKKPASQAEDDAAARAELLATLDAEAESEDDEKP
jgi:hypothetical protein